MQSALNDIIKQRNHEQREINDAQTNIERLRERIKHLEESIEKKEQLVSDYDAIIEHSRLLLPKDITDSIPHIGEEMNHENK